MPAPSAKDAERRLCRRQRQVRGRRL